MTADTPHSDETMTEKGGIERRRHGRASADWPITLNLADGVYEAKLRDLSRGGVCFFLDRPLSPMTLLRLELKLPVPGGVRNVIGSGAVVRCEKISARLDHYEIAVFLQDVAEPDRDALEGFVRARQAAAAE